MDFGLVGLDSFVCSNSATPPPNNGGGGFSLQTAAAAAEADSSKQKWSGGFGFVNKHERAINEEELRDFIKVAKTSCSNINSSSSNILTADSHHQQMLSFSSPNSQTSTSSYYNHRSAGMNGVLSAGVRSSGPLFTAAQWMELEHQALIYKYITANVPIPSHLLNPIRKAFESAGFSPFSGLRSNPLGWGAAFQLGFSNTDPEPGRCRRTDGKKWRCSRDAVADQKYCERHMNRGRHRSRKPVEGQPAAPSVTTAAAKRTSSTAGGGAAAASSNLGLSHHHHQLTSSNHISGLPPNINNSLKDNIYEEETSFGLVCSDSLLNPLNRSSSLINGGDSSSSDNINGHNQSQSSHHPLIRQFIDDFPKNNHHTERASTQLSISIPTDEIRSSGDLEMGLGVGPFSGEERNLRQANKWVPISWDPSMGGPLGEVLHNSASTSECNNNNNMTKPLNFMDRWDNNSPRLASSPTGVLQRGSFVSLSNSSGGSSPRGGDVSGLFHGLIVGPVLTNPSL